MHPLLPFLAVAAFADSSRLDLTPFVPTDTAVGRAATVFHEVMSLPILGPQNLEVGQARITRSSKTALKLEGTVDYLGHTGALLYSIEASGPSDLRYDVQFAEKRFSGTAPWSAQNGELVSGKDGLTLRQRVEPGGIKVRVDSGSTPIVLHIVYAR